MVLSHIIKHKKLITSNLRAIKKIILLLVFASLFNIKPKTDKIFTDQFLHEFLPLSKNVILNYKNINDFDFVNKQFKLGNESVAKTILIEGELKNIVHLLTIYSTLKEAKYLHRSIVIKVNENGFFDKYGKYFNTNSFKMFKKRFCKDINDKDECCNKEYNKKFVCHTSANPYKTLTNTFYKEIQQIRDQKDDKSWERCDISHYYKKITDMIKSKNKQTDNSKYFAALKISFNNETYINIDVLKNYMPNSDLLFVAKYFFDTKLIYNINHIFCTNFNINTMEITLKPDIQSFSQLVTLIRCINNLHSYSLGNYYYVPFYETHITLMQIFPFIMLMFAYFAFDYCFCEKDEHINSIMVIVCFTYLFCPVISILPIFYYKTSPAKNAFFIVFFTIVNFRFGFLYTTILLLLDLRAINKS